MNVPFPFLLLIHTAAFGRFFYFCSRFITVLRCLPQKDENLVFKVRFTLILPWLSRCGNGPERPTGTARGQAQPSPDEIQF